MECGITGKIFMLCNLGDVGQEIGGTKTALTPQAGVSNPLPAAAAVRTSGRL